MTPVTVSVRRHDGFAYNSLVGGLGDALVGTSSSDVMDKGPKPLVVFSGHLALV